MPSARIRFVGEATLLVLVAVGLALARFDPLVIATVMFLALALVALLEHASAKEAARGTRSGDEAEASTPPPHVDRDMEAAAPAGAERAPEPEPEPTVSERSARAILATTQPPLPPERTKALPEGADRPAAPSPERDSEPEPEPDPQPEPEPLLAFAEPPTEWNLWELQRAVRDAADDDRHEEWTALLMHLREFANAEGDLPREFDGLVRESFAPLLGRPQERAAAS